MTIDGDIRVGASHGLDERPEVTLHADPINVQSWMLLRGLVSLAEEERIRLHIADLRRPQGRGHWLNVRWRDNPRVATVHFDGQDAPTPCSESRLEAADAVWKRSFQPGGPAKILPFGYSISCAAGPLDTARYLRSSLSVSRGSWQGTRRSLASWRLLRRQPFLPQSAFEHPPSAGEGTVLFQVRAWPPGSTGAEDREAINEQRAELIRELRNAFGDRFWGGFVDSEFSRHRYADCISPLAADQRSFIDLVKRCDVAISTVGLHGSNPHKVAEYLAASRPIVSEPLRCQAAHPLRETEHLRTVHDVAEAVTAVGDILDDPASAAAMRQANHRYWRDHGQPSETVAYGLNQLRNDHVQKGTSS